MENQSELYTEVVQLVEKLGQELPGLRASQRAMTEEAYKDGALSRKVKRLMALAIGLRASVTPCILVQTKLAIEAGATKGEVLETIGVSMAMSGTSGTAASLRVIKLLEELGTQ